MANARRDRRTSPATTWAAVAIALVMHGVFAVTVHAVGAAAGFGTRPWRAGAAELAEGCVADVALASSARLALCFAPWQADLAACVGDARTSAWVDLATCRAQDDSHVAQVSVLDPRVAERLPALDPSQLLAAVPNRDQPQPQPPDAVPPAPQPPPQPTRPSQVVETAKPAEQKAPDHARFLAEYDTAVAKQTVARGAANEPMVANSKPSSLAATQHPREAAVKQRVDQPPGQSMPPNAGMLTMRAPGAGTGKSTPEARAPGTVAGASGAASADGYLPPKGQGAIASSQRDRSELPLGNGGVAGAPDVPNLKPTADVLERAVGGGSVDHLEDVETGESTALSAKRWVHASFFNRLKRQVAQHWDPGSVWRRADPRGQVYGTKTRITEVRVSLSTVGQLARIVITAPSGVTDLDDEALRAFRVAGPFPNPPVDLAGSDRLITFAFAFYFQIGAPHMSWRVIRSM